jgi:hypothetical protein
MAGMARRRPSADRDWDLAPTAGGLLAIRFPDHRTPETPGVRRKLRLVLCGAARTVWDRLPPDLRGCVGVAERFADDLATRKELDEARQAAARRLIAGRADRNAAAGQIDFMQPVAMQRVARMLAEAEFTIAAAELVQACCQRSVTVARIADRVLAEVPRLAAPLTAWEVGVMDGWDGAWEIGPDPAAAVVRDVFGGPVAPPVNAAWQTPTVAAVAAGIAADGAFDRLPVLADALEDAGCEDARVLGHCRGPGPHWRGCWVVDALAAAGRGP